MNLILLLIGMWFIFFLVCLIIFASLLDGKKCKKYGKAILLLSFMISTSITFLIGGIIG